MNSILLIGMPGCGKSTIGVLLAEKLGLEFVDGDEYIEKEKGMRLQEILDELGDEGFMRLEEEVILKMRLGGRVLALGGSLVYNDELMKRLTRECLVVFLKVPLEELEKRITNAERRGIVGLKSESLEELFNERTLLCKKYASFTFSWEVGESVESCTDRIINIVNPNI